MKFRVKRKFGRFFTNIRNGHCFSQNENSRCSSKTVRKIEQKVAKSRNEFSRTVLDRIERSRENSFRADRGKHHLNLHVDLPVFSRDFMLYCDDANAHAHGNSCCLYRALKIEDQLILSSHAESIFLHAKSNRVSSRAKSSPGGDIQVIEERRVSSQLCNCYKNHPGAETDGNHRQGQEYRKAQKVKRRSQNLH